MSRRPDRPGVGAARITRRGVLALAGATALAGCSALDALGGEEPVELDGEAVAAIPDGEPSVTEPFPVAVAESHARASADRARESLDQAPLPFDDGEIPNGAMREELTHRADRARESLERADAAESDRQRLRHLASARERARSVAAAWAYVEGDLAPADVREAAAAVGSDAQAFRDAWEYVGDDPVRALLAAEVVESKASAAGRYAERDRPGERAENALTVGEDAGEVEHARASLADARHVAERFRDSLSEERALRGTFEGAREALIGEIRTRRDSLPGDPEEPSSLHPDDLDGTTTESAVEELAWRVPEDEHLPGTGDPASDVLRRCEWLAYTEALAALLDRVDDGERYAVESVDELRERRTTAVEALRTALAESDDERLARWIGADVKHMIARADDGLDRHGETVDARYLDGEIGEYVAAAFAADAIPDACATALDALDAA